MGQTETVKLELPEYLRKNYPFESHFFEQPGGVKQHYVDEGKGDPIVMIHGNPTWSFYYRDLVKEFQKKYRVIAPDHIGSGLSDKPLEYSYTLENHIQNIERLLEHLNLKNVTLVVHDWGGTIGFGYATRHPENVKKMVVLNTAAFRSKELPWRIGLCKLPLIGEQIIRVFNGFAWPATWMAVKKPLNDDVKQGYIYPYNNYRNRIGNARFVQDIPLDASHPSYQTLVGIEQNLGKVDCEKLFLWGAKDFCFTMNFFHRFLEFYPDAKHFVFEDAGHYVIEDATQGIIEKMNLFLQDKWSKAS